MAKKKSEASRMFIGGKSALDNFPELRWLFDPLGLQIDQSMRFMSLAVSRRYKQEIDLTEVPWVMLSQRNLHETEFNQNFDNQMPMQVKMGIFTTDFSKNDKDKKEEETDDEEDSKRDPDEPKDEEADELVEAFYEDD